MEQISVQGTEHECHVKGERIFSRDPEDLVVQDVFIRPRRPGPALPGRIRPTAQGSEPIIPTKGHRAFFTAQPKKATRQKVKKEGGQRILIKITG